MKDCLRLCVQSYIVGGTCPSECVMIMITTIKRYTPPSHKSGVQRDLPLMNTFTNTNTANGESASPGDLTGKYELCFACVTGQ